MTDSGDWLAQAHDHVATAQAVLGDLERGLATAQRVEVAAERAAPVLRTLLLAAVAGATVAAVVVLVRRRRRHADDDNGSDVRAERYEGNVTPLRVLDGAAG
jgi:hypothetical protein